MTATLSHEPRFQLATAETWPNPWPMYRALRDHDPVHHVVPRNRPEDDYYVLTRHANIWAAARDHETPAALEIEVHLQGGNVPRGRRRQLEHRVAGNDGLPFGRNAVQTQLPTLLGSRQTLSKGRRQACGAMSWWIAFGPHDPGS